MVESVAEVICKENQSLEAFERLDCIELVGEFRTNLRIPTTLVLIAGVK